MCIVKNQKNIIKSTLHHQVLILRQYSKFSLDQKISHTGGILIQMSNVGSNLHLDFMSLKFLVINHNFFFRMTFLKTQSNHLLQNIPGFVWFLCFVLLTNYTLYQEFNKSNLNILPRIIHRQWCVFNVALYQKAHNI